MEIRGVWGQFFMLLREHVQDSLFKRIHKPLFLFEVVVHPLIEHIHHVIALDIEGSFGIDGIQERIG